MVIGTENLPRPLRRRGVPTGVFCHGLKPPPTPPKEGSAYRVFCHGLARTDSD